MSTVAVYEEEDPGEEGKVCNCCNRMLPEYRFGPRASTDPRYLGMVKYHCTECTTAGLRARTYRLSEAQMREFSSVTNCAICDDTLTRGRGLLGRVIDHCHETGRIRDVLCGACNRGLGCAKDSPDRLRKMALYIEAHRVS